MILITLILLLVLTGLVMNYTNSTKIDCNKLVYSADWPLDYLRDISRRCSDGE